MTNRINGHASLLDATPPHSPDAERGLLGSILLDPSKLADVRPIVEPFDFHVPQFRTIFAALLALADDGQAADDAGDVVTLKAFTERYIRSREADTKPSTITNLRQAERYLLEHFGPAKPLHDVTPGDADDFRRWLSPKVADNTARRMLGRCKQLFRAAQRKRLVTDNPFGDTKKLGVQPNKAREHFIDRATTEKLLEVCIDNQWKLLVGLARYAGLRTPSEPLALTWGDVDSERNRLRVRSVKTEHHGEQHAERIIPLFPELRPMLQSALDELLESFDPKRERLSEQPIITRYRDTRTNLRTQLLRTIRKAGLATWEKPWQNLRSSQATELAAEFPQHVAAAWLGHSTVIANKFYRQVTDTDFARAVGGTATTRETSSENCADFVATERSKGRQTATATITNTAGNRSISQVAVSKAPRLGLEPRT